MNTKKSILEIVGEDVLDKIDGRLEFDTCTLEDIEDAVYQTDTIDLTKDQMIELVDYYVLETGLANRIYNSEPELNKER